MLMITDAFLLILSIPMFTTTHKRQSSLKNLRSVKSTLAFSPQRLLPSITEHREVKKVNGKELTQAISKFNGMNKKQSMRFTDQLLRNAIIVLKTFGHVENNFQDLFQQVYEVVKRFCLALDDEEILETLKKYRIKPGTSYRQAILMMDEELDHIMKDKNDIISNLREVEAKLRQNYAIKEINWKNEREFFVAEVDRYKKLANIQYMESLEALIETQKTEISELNAKANHLENKNEELQRQIDHKDNLIHELSFQNSQLKADVFDITKKLDKTDNYFIELKDKFDGLLVKMMGLKEIIAKVEGENEQLVSERMHLVNRTAVSFTDLTPRPKYKAIFEMPVKSHINSTADIFSNLVQQSNLSKKQIIQNVVLKKRTSKLKEAQAIRQKVVEDIISSKKQMKKLSK